MRRRAAAVLALLVRAAALAPTRRDALRHIAAAAPLALAPRADARERPGEKIDEITAKRYRAIYAARRRRH